MEFPHPTHTATPLQTWYQTQFLPWKQESEAYRKAYAEQAEKIKTHVPQLEAMVGMLLEGRTRAAVLAWNALGLHPALKDVRLGPDGETLTLLPTSGDPQVLKIADLLAELGKMTNT
jgi:hypothetical protein